MPENCFGTKSKPGAMNNEFHHRWVLASHNIPKAEELRAMLSPFKVQLNTLTELNIVKVPDESGNTFRENALIKAKAAWSSTGLQALADDSGLEVDALGGLPGVHTARFAGVDATDQENVQLLLKQLSNQENRKARFVCVLCLWDGSLANYWEGKVEGKILMAPRGLNGFGYDPVFEAEEIPGKSLAELEPQMKNKISHRAAAVQSMLASLDSI